MIDYFTLALTHGLIVIALWRLLSRPELDVDPLPAREDAPRGAQAANRRSGTRNRPGRGSDA